MTETEKRKAYRQIRAELEPLLEAAGDPIAAMATFASVLHHHLAYTSWVGFYRVVEPELLRVGP